ncbi:MAG: sugar MFS transporter [Bacteroidales bacterium]|nr:sugar MFS transporter [Bacteroidales bacterium]
MKTTERNNSVLPMISVTILFFMWGFITSLNDILIPYFKTVYQLSHFQANIVQFAFFIAYFVCAFIFYLLSVKGKDPISRFGYKGTLTIGLFTASLSCFLFSFVARLQLPFVCFLVSLFLLGTGLTFLQVAANPFVSLIGKRETASSRLNLTQAFNSLGTTLGPALGGYFIFSYFADKSGENFAVTTPYLFLAFLLLALGVFISFSKISIAEEEQNNLSSAESIFKKPYVVLGALGVFFYVGAEVAVGSNLISYMKEVISIDAEHASAFVSYYWGGAMIGRFLGAVSLSDVSKTRKIVSMILLALLCFVIIFAVNWMLHGLAFRLVWFFLVFIALNFMFFCLGKGNTALTLAIFAMVNIALLICGIGINNGVAVWSLIAIGLFNSIMWSNVFTLAIDGLGKQTSSASSILIMMILGGAIVPPLQGILADVSSVRISYFIPMVSYIYLCFYGLKGYKIGKPKSLK